MEARGPCQRRLVAGFLDHGVHHRCHDPSGDVLASRATLLGEPGKLLARTSELVVEDCLRVAVKCAVAVTHLATTAVLGAGSDSRTRLGAGVGNVKPQNMRAIPTSSPR